MNETNQLRRLSLSAFTLIAVLGIASSLLYPVLRAGFLTDDFVALRLIADDVDLDDGLSQSNQKALVQPYAKKMDERYHLYRPSMLLSFGLNLLVSGPSPRAFQVVNLCLHLLCGALLFLLLRTALPRATLWAACGATLWFLISPLQIEAVAWSVARSETLSLGFGLAALVWRLRFPAGRFMPAVFCALALTCKESALLFPLAIVLLDGFDPSGLRPVKTDRRSCIQRIAPLAAVVVFWIGVRWWIFGTPFGGTYNDQSLSGYLSDPVALGARYLRSMAQVFSPISSIAYASSPMTTILSLCMAAGTGGIVIGGLVVGFSKQRRLLVLALALVLVPVALGVLVNEIGSALVNSRAAYTTLAGLGLLAVMGTELLPRGWVRCLPLLLVLCMSGTTVRATIAPWVEVHTQLQARLDSIREPIIGRDIDAVMLLDYQEARYLNDAHDMSVGTRYAIGLPFLEHNVTLYKLGCGADVVDPSSLRYATLVDTARVAVFAPKKGAEKEFQLLYGGERRTDRSWIELGDPVPNALIEVGADSPGLHFTCRVTAAHDQKLFLHILTDKRAFPPVPADALSKPVSSEPVKRTFTLGIFGEDVLNALKEATPFLWFVTAGPDQGTAVLASPLRRILVERASR